MPPLGQLIKNCQKE